MVEALTTRSCVLEASPAGDGLSDFQSECVAIFSQAARAVALPRSVGQIYGLLYATNRPLPLDAVVQSLRISKGSASQGLRWLRDLGAIKVASVEGDRRDHFVAEIELRRLATGFLRGTVEPHLKNGGGHLARLDQAKDRLPVGPDRSFASNRLTKLRRWHKFARQVLPLVVKATERF